MAKWRDVKHKKNSSLEFLKNFKQITKIFIALIEKSIEIKVKRLKNKKHSNTLDIFQLYKQHYCKKNIKKNFTHFFYIHYQKLLKYKFKQKKINPKTNDVYKFSLCK